MSGVNFDGRIIRKGAADAIAKYLQQNGGSALPKEVQSNRGRRLPAPAARRW